MKKIAYLAYVAMMASGILLFATMIISMIAVYAYTLTIHQMLQILIFGTSISVVFVVSLIIYVVKAKL